MRQFISTSRQRLRRPRGPLLAVLLTASLVGCVMLPYMVLVPDSANSAPQNGYVLNGINVRSGTPNLARFLVSTACRSTSVNFSWSCQHPNPPAAAAPDPSMLV